MLARPNMDCVSRTSKRNLFQPAINASIFIFNSKCYRVSALKAVPHSPPPPLPRFQKNKQAQLMAFVNSALLQLLTINPSK